MKIVFSNEINFIVVFFHYFYISYSRKGEIYVIFIEKINDLRDNISMPIKLKNSSVLLVNKEFKISPKGYNGLEVDQLLDQIIKDYELVENNCLLSKQEAESLQKKIDDLISGYRLNLIMKKVDGSTLSLMEKISISIT